MSDGGFDPSDPQWAYAAIRSYFQQYGPARHHPEAMNDFILDKLVRIIHENDNHIMVGISPDGTKMLRAELSDIHLELPTVQDPDGFYVDTSPCDSKAKRLHYVSTLLARLHVARYQKKDLETEEPISLPPRSRRRFNESVDQARVAKIGAYPDETWEMVERHVQNNVVVLEIPALVGTESCIYSKDPSADMHRTDGFAKDVMYQFVCKNVERAVIIVERMETNRIVFDGVNYQLRCANDSRCRSTSTLKFKYLVDGPVGLQRMGVNIPHARKTAYVPVQMIARLLGFSTAAAAAAAIACRGTTMETPDCKGSESFEWAYELMRHKPGYKTPNPWIMTRDQVAFWVSSFAIPKHSSDRSETLRNMAHLLRDEIFPNVSLESSDAALHSKSLELASVLWRIWAMSTKKIGTASRDHFVNKRLDTSGYMMALLIRQLIVSFHRKMDKTLEEFVDIDMSCKNIANMITAFSKRMGTNVRNAVSKGTMTRRSSSAQHSVTELCSFFSYVSTLSLLRRIMNKSGGMQTSTDKRQLHTSSWGFLDAAETPEGQTIGFIKALGMLCRLCIGARFDEFAPVIMFEIAAIIWQQSLEPFDQYADRIEETGLPRPTSNYGAWRIRINGRPVGTTHHPILVHQVLLNMRRDKMLPDGTSIAWDETCDEIRLLCDVGGPRIAVGVTSRIEVAFKIYVKHSSGPPRMVGLWEELEDEGCIDWLSSDEILSTVVAKTPEEAVKAGAASFPYYFLHGIATLGACTSLAPACSFNQAPRVTYEVAMMKQSLSKRSPGANWLNGFETCNEELPMSASVTETFFEGTDVSRTSNTVIMVGSYTCYNIDDATIFNKSSIELGKFDTYMYRVYTDTVLSRESNKQKLCVPDKDVIGRTTADYSQLDPETGIIKLGAAVKANTVLIGKTVTVKDIGHARQFNTERDVSLTARHGDPDGRVDKVHVEEGHNGTTIVRVRVRCLIRPEVGDKFSTRHGQKGVIGLILPAEDMPYNEHGIRPDVIVNGHGFPSRMTIGQLKEAMINMVAVASGHFQDVTPFHDLPDVGDDIDPTMFRILNSMALTKDCETQMYSGFDGLPLETQSSLAVIPLQQLKHRARDKIHARQTGPVAFFTRQPVEGRLRKGGHRNGVMEDDADAAHGAAYCLTAISNVNSDAHTVAACTACGCLAYVNKKSGKRVCPKCHGDANVVETLGMPYASKQAYQEQQAMHINTKLDISIMQDGVGVSAHPRSETEKVFAQASVQSKRRNPVGLVLT